jgi:hypothetical protein
MIDNKAATNIRTLDHSYFMIELFDLAPQNDQSNI